MSNLSTVHGETLRVAQIHPQIFAHTNFVSRPRGLQSACAQLERHKVEGFLNLKSAGRRQFGEGSWRISFGQVKGYKDEILLNRNTDSIRTTFLYTVLHVVVLNMMECYY